MLEKFFEKKATFNKRTKTRALLSLRISKNLLNTQRSIVMEITIPVPPTGMKKLKMQLSHHHRHMSKTIGDFQVSSDHSKAVKRLSSLEVVSTLRGKVAWASNLSKKL